MAYPRPITHTRPWAKCVAVETGVDKGVRTFTAGPPEYFIGAQSVAKEECLAAVAAAERAISRDRAHP